jgi:hypothetical protein
MIYIKYLNGNEKAISRLVLEQLRMLMDWQIRQLGYCPQSITLACQKCEFCHSPWKETIF